LALEFFGLGDILLCGFHVQDYSRVIGSLSRYFAAFSNQSTVAKYGKYRLQRWHKTPLAPYGSR
jgi:hypothetical protein